MKVKDLLPWWRQNELPLVPLKTFLFRGSHNFHESKGEVFGMEVT